ncbi:hypothetical protein BX600DRAFT_442895 [Xylariales sp. PMI_506]|nr:hypothetical protein BX600DRAFT_442895 [Xylariales sp. PMI_506]
MDVRPSHRGGAGEPENIEPHPTHVRDHTRKSPSLVPYSAIAHLPMCWAPTELAVLRPTEDLPHGASTAGARPPHPLTLPASSGRSPFTHAAAPDSGSETGPKSIMSSHLAVAPPHNPDAPNPYLHCILSTLASTSPFACPPLLVCFAVSLASFAPLPLQTPDCRHAQSLAPPPPIRTTERRFLGGLTPCFVATLVSRVSRALLAFCHLRFPALKGH